ncbi:MULTISPECIES: LytR C-terminal domain-containing protein [Arthrobacter]|uniref:LytR C-terminal domain-containing protein n=2 Tax=Arthrobacter TaxID=1663 RepID=A0ABU9KLI0_9MICC|nr:LytR C-terminal domain-containing protein [Arthrobacter sp. YJM1]MDP5227764.1 LytR C-terminal domain-containing protein [Arthrobacter sp. YJM1]
MTTYPHDEFDDVPESTERRGVHRSAQPRPAALKPILITGAVALLLGIIVYLAFPTLGVRADAGKAPSAPVSTAAPKPSATPTPSAPKPSAPPVDRTLTVSVFNGTATPGQAAKYGEKVTAAGWKLGPVGNWTGTAQTGSVVFYSVESAKASATALAAALGITDVRLGSGLEEPLVVVVGPGAP